MASDRYTLALVQVNPRLGDVDANREMVAQQVREARGRGADLVIFPELALTGYFLKDQVPTVAWRLDGPEVKWLASLSQETAIIVGMVEESPETLFYNSAVYLERGELRHVHRKCYLPTYGLFDEQRYFARGRHVGAFETRFGRMALLICEDMWHPSAVYLAALDRALSIVCISASPIWGVTTDELPENAAHWRQIVRFHAATWATPVAYCNRVGFEDGIGFWGGSELVDASGEQVAAAPLYEPAMVTAEIDLRALRRRRISATILRDEDLDLTLNELNRIRQTYAGATELGPASKTGRTAPVAKKPAGRADALLAARRRGRL